MFQISQEFDDKTDEMADKAVDAVKKSVSSFWKYASGYATQMFTEEDLESEAIMIGDDKVRRPQNFHPSSRRGHVHMMS